MKRNLSAAILGIAASAGIIASARGQGRVFFNNYASSTTAPVFYGPGSDGPVGTGINSSYTAGLWYFLGTATLPEDDYGMTFMPSGWELASVTQQFATAGPGSQGYFVGPIAQIPDYVSGPITFAVTAYNGTAYGSATTTLEAHSAGFTLSSIATGANPTGQFGPGFHSFSVSAPEPSVFALSGIAAALVLLRRKGRA